MMKKRTYTRRQRALRWLTMLIAAVLILQLSGAVCLLPGQVIAHTEQQKLLGETEIFYRSWGKAPPMRTKRLFLSRNEDVILMSVAVPSLMGWYELAPSIVLDLNDPEMRHAKWTVLKDDTVWVCLVGFVPEGEEAPTYSMGEGTFSEERNDDLGYYRFTGEPLTVTPTADIPTEGGNCYLTICSLPRPEDLRTNTIIVARNDDGYLSQIKNGWSTSLG